MQLMKTEHYVNNNIKQKHNLFQFETSEDKLTVM